MFYNFRASVFLTVERLNANEEDETRVHFQMWRLAGPIIISNISVPVLGAVDTAVVGHLPDAKYLGGVAVGALVFTFIYWGFGFLRMSTGGLTAQAIGLADMDEVRGCLARAAVIGIPAAFILILLQGPIAWLSFSIVDATPEVEALAREYFFTYLGCSGNTFKFRVTWLVYRHPKYKSRIMAPVDT